MAGERISEPAPEVELDQPPFFEFGEKVRSLRTIRNDGTYRGKDIGEILCRKGEVGYVVDIGTYLQQFYIYGVEYITSGYRVGMKRKELESAEYFATEALE
ncbi:MAG TPA: nitrogen fixation protein NifZ [Fibrobacteria bacterium]|nr:nitrogen fixation protein NifZ [Fibrobacteria bacterium]